MDYSAKQIEKKAKEDEKANIRLICKVYEQRPKACREYPHTDRKKIYQILDLTLKNSYVCPAVIEILGDLRIWERQS